MLLASAAAIVVVPSLGDQDSSITLSNGGLTATKNATSSPAYAFGVSGKTTGKWRFQVTVNAVSGDLSLGITGGLYSNRDTYLGSAGGNGIALNSTASTGVLYNGTTQYGYSVSNMTAGDVWDIYLDADAGRVWFARNGTVLNGSPFAGTGGTLVSSMRKAFYPAVYLYGATNSVTFNFGSTAFVNAGITGFNAWLADVPLATLAKFQSFGMVIRDVGWWSHSWAETELMTTSGGANMLAGSTGSYSSNVTSFAGPMSNLTDGDPTTGAGFQTVNAQNQSPVWVAHDLGSFATRNAAFMAIRENFGTGGQALQTPILFDLWVCDGPVATGNWFKTHSLGVTMTWVATSASPGQRQEFAVS